MKKWVNLCRNSLSVVNFNVVSTIYFLISFNSGKLVNDKLSNIEYNLITI